MFYKRNEVFWIKYQGLQMADSSEQRHDYVLAENRVTASKAAIVARHIAVLTALQINFEVVTE